MSKRLLIALALGALLCSVQLWPSKADEETDALGDEEPEEEETSDEGGMPDDGGIPGGSDYGGDYGGYGDDYGGGGGGGGSLSDNIKGFVDLDDITFNKVVDGSRYIFVVFYSPWDTASKDLMPELEAVGEEAGAQDNLLLVKANGEDNEKLKEKFGWKEDDLPLILAAPKGQAKDVKAYKKFEGEKKDTDTLLEFLETVAGAPGTVPDLAIAVEKFMAAPSSAGIAEAEKVVATLDEAEKVTGAYYVKAMGKVVSKGKDYPKSESDRLKRMIEGGKIREDKVKEFKHRINALRVFDSTIEKLPRDKPEDEMDADVDADADTASDDDAAASDDKTEL